MIVTTIAGYAAASAIAAGSLLAFYGTFSPRGRVWGPLDWRGNRKGLVALTFDDGPTPGVTDAILEQLCALDVPATFFLIGRNARRSPEQVLQIQRQGHQIGNHSFDHDHLGMFGGPGYWRRQVEMTDAVIQQITGERPSLFRPPMGFSTPFIHQAAKRNGHRVVTWSRRGFDGLGSSPESILRRLATPARGGDILLLHDGVDPHLTRPKFVKRSATIAAIRPLVERLRDKGLTPVRLDELLGDSCELLPGQDVTAKI